jgi:hypothetical protein
LMLRFTLLALGIQLSLSGCVYYFNATMRAERFQLRLANSATLAGRLLEHLPTQPAHRNDLLTLPREEISIYGPDNTLRYSSADHLDQAANRERLAGLGAGQQISYPPKTGKRRWAWLFRRARRWATTAFLCRPKTG